MLLRNSRAVGGNYNSVGATPPPRRASVKRHGVTKYTTTAVQRNVARAAWHQYGMRSKWYCSAAAGNGQQMVVAAGSALMPAKAVEE